MPPQNDMPPARPVLPMLVTPSERWLVSLTLWLALFCNIVAGSLLSGQIRPANIAGFLSIILLVISALGVALRIIWRFCPGWTRWLSSAALLACALAAYTFFAPPLFPFAGSSADTILSDALGGVCAVLVVLSALFTLTALEDRRTANR